MGLSMLGLAGAAVYQRFLVQTELEAASPWLALLYHLGLFVMIAGMAATLPWDRRKTCPDCGKPRS
jgi:hypothetical protein